MPRYEAQNFLSAVPDGSGLMALDVSPKRIGIAFTEASRGVALPAKTMVRGKWEDDAAELLTFIEEHRIGGIVIGLPLNLDGTKGPAAQSRLSFARNLDQYLAEKGLMIAHTMVDESLTSNAARELLHGRSNTKNVEDQIAATLILQQFIKI